MDMTSGYHQAPIAAESRIFTAFITFMGVFHWMRVPMGLKSAGSYFQRVMATVVLTGLLYIFCELYLDDILVYGSDDNDFASNLRKVLVKLRKHKVTLSPKKCKFGFNTIIYVGHTITPEGLTFSEQKRDKALEFPPPKTAKELLSFLGLVNYFRAHVCDLAKYEHPLRALIEGKYNKSQKIIWTSELEEVFYQLRDIVGNCPQLHFYDPKLPLWVMTDASDYGIGAYFYQVINGRRIRTEVLLGFIATRNKRRFNVKWRYSYSSA
jgi:hypothetical protein